MSWRVIVEKTFPKLSRVATLEKNSTVLSCRRGKGGGQIAFFKIFHPQKHFIMTNAN